MRLWRMWFAWCIFYVLWTASWLIGAVNSVSRSPKVGEAVSIHGQVVWKAERLLFFFFLQRYSKDIIDSFSNLYVYQEHHQHPRNDAIDGLTMKGIGWMCVNISHRASSTQFPAEQETHVCRSHDSMINAAKRHLYKRSCCISFKELCTYLKMLLAVYDFSTNIYV